MKQFRFHSRGIAPNTVRNYLNPLCKTLSHLFSVNDIKIGMFSPSITKRLLSAKKHGTEIVLRRMKFGRTVSVKVVDKDDRKKTSDKKRKLTRQLKKKLKILSLSNDVNSYLKFLKELSKVSGDTYLRNACIVIYGKKRDWKI